MAAKLADALRPSPLTRAQSKHKRRNRLWQGIPGIAVTAKGRIFVAWYTGGTGEGLDNFVAVAFSDDNGAHWSDAEWVVDPAAAIPGIRAFDECLWYSPEGEIWLFWSQCRCRWNLDCFDGRNGVWCSRLPNPDAPVGEWRWSAPRRIADGVMLNKPAVLADGTWALPVSVWNRVKLPGDTDSRGIRSRRADRGAKMVVSRDRGVTFTEYGKCLIPLDTGLFDEHTIVEFPDGSLKMFIRRTPWGNQESVSNDGGRTWSKPIRSDIDGPCSRLWIRRLNSGRLMLVYNDSGIARKRVRMTAFLSDDDGKTWYGGLVLDPRIEVSYPDGQQTADGSIWIVHDCERNGSGEIVVSHITEEDVAAGKLISPQSRLRIVASRLPARPAKK